MNILKLNVAIFSSLLFLLFAVVDTATRADEDFGDKDLKFFTDEVRPILESKCIKCHSGPKPKGGLNLTTREAVLKGGESGPAVSNENVGESLLLQAINYDGFEMPPDRQLPQAQSPKM